MHTDTTNRKSYFSDKVCKDDDLYVYKLDTLEFVEHVDYASPRRRNIKLGFEKLDSGLAFVFGLTAKRLGMWIPHAV